MAEEPCTVCGERNPVRTQFCNFCGAYLGWDDEDAPTAPVVLSEPVRERVRTEQVPDEGETEPPAVSSSPSAPPPPPDATTRIQVPQHARGEHRDHRSPPPDGREVTSDDIDPDSALQAEILQREVVVTPGAAPGAVSVRVSNSSTIVEAYDVSVVHPPPWLVVTPGRLQLLPGTDEVVVVHLSIRPEDLVPVQRARLRLRVQGESAVPLRRDASVDLVIGAVAAPLELRLEPSTLRGRDSTTALFRVVVDNRRSNQAQFVQFTGHDPELAARFVFTPPELEVPPGTAVAARVRVDAALPDPGEQLTRTLTVSAFDGRQEHEVRGTFIQVATAPVEDPPVALRLDPSIVKVQNASAGHTSVILDNRRGTRPQLVSLTADDDEGLVELTVSPEQIEVPAGQSAMARVTIRAARPDGGQEVSRSITVTAWNGEDVSETRGQFVQSSSDRRPMARAALTTLGSAAIVLGSFQPWTTNPRGTGHQWSITNFDNFTGIEDQELTDALDQAGVHDLVDTLVSGGSIALLLGAVALFGLTGRTGRLTRIAALLCLLFVVAFLAALSVRAGVGVNGGAIVVLVGAVTAYIGGFLARRP
ncbi:hypothetical protein MWU75_13040 [Ornithinimicrobium sp. F0845]|uniref:COG1470 family protein n=1 Tax=Ornithinimicrobium sp. F0845 TaxID=2926412 RepID=UPI001FF2ACFF|nr:hypothetical protein [Ornithinimicrobium sp. F0845]MCK0113069.1 hypothetical protein [Ornithinimicrobium sp. F0845]